MNSEYVADFASEQAADIVGIHNHDGESWQLMGFGSDSSGWLTCFRHRFHPMTESRKVVCLSVEIGQAAGTPALTR